MVRWVKALHRRLIFTAEVNGGERLRVQALLPLLKGTITRNSMPKVRRAIMLSILPLSRIRLGKVSIRTSVEPRNTLREKALEVGAATLLQTRSPLYHPSILDIRPRLPCPGLFRKNSTAEPPRLSPAAPVHRSQLCLEYLQSRSPAARNTNARDAVRRLLLPCLVPRRPCLSNPLQLR